MTPLYPPPRLASEVLALTTSHSPARALPGPPLVLGTVLPRPDPGRSSCHSCPTREASPSSPSTLELPVSPGAPLLAPPGPRGRSSHRPKGPPSGDVGSCPEQCGADLLAPAGNGLHGLFDPTMRGPRPWREPLTLLGPVWGGKASCQAVGRQMGRRAAQRPWGLCATPFPSVPLPSPPLPAPEGPHAMGPESWQAEGTGGHGPGQPPGLLFPVQMGKRSSLGLLEWGLSRAPH